MRHPTFYANQIGCYDSKRNRMYAAQGSSMAFFNFSNNTWTMVNGGGQSYPSANSAVLHYDSASDVILYHYAQSSRTGTWGGIGIYDPAQNTWSHPSNTFPGNVSVNYMNYNSFYDSRLNVHFFYVAGDGSENGTMLAYRYKKVDTRVENVQPRSSAGIRLSPNPWHGGNLTIRTASDQGVVSIVSIQGREVARLKAAPVLKWCKKDGIAPGVYIVRHIENGKLVSSVKVINIY
jgi:hypothetical protein